MNAVAAGFGLAPGQRATDAMAGHGDLVARYADPAWEARALASLAAWCRRWSPSTRADGTDGVALDVTGCAHLFGGEAALLDAMAARLDAMGLTASLAVAPNHAAAHALARYDAKPGRPACVAEDLAARIGPLPVAALRIDPASITLLRRLGLKTIADVDRMPRATLKKRFGAGRKHRDPRDDTYDDYLGRSTGTSADVLVRLDEMMGRVHVPLDPGRPVDPARIVRGLAEPVLEVEAMLACLRPMIVDVVALLEKRDEGVLALGLEAFRVDGGRVSTVLRLSRATRRTDRMMRLLIDRLDGWHAEFGFDALAVEATETAALPPQQTDHMTARREADMHALVDRLRTRLGHDAVLQPVSRQSHVPERAQVWIAPRTLDEPAVREAPCARVRRPDRMFERPEEIAVLYALPEGPPARFTWRHATHDVTLVAGPERIAPEWWRERSHIRARDYFRVETAAGRRFWIFREGFEGDERGAPPRWFMHGLFS